MKTVLNLKSILIIFAFLTNNINNSNAQDYLHVKDFVNIDRITPPSPTASSLGEYAEVPVSLFTGKPSINIPLFNVQVNDFSMPVELNYASGGIKVEDQASWVGLGWSLNAGGVITRTVCGLPDETTLGYFRIANDYDDIIFYGFSDFSPVSNLDEDAMEYYNKLHLMSLGLMDGQPDIFYYNFNGYSGKIIFDEYRKVNFISGGNLKVNYLTEADGFTICTFIFTTPDGVQYKFDAKEITKPITKSGKFTEYDYITSNPNGPWDFSDNDFNQSDFVSSWFLTKITFPNSYESIDFIYEDENIFLPVTTSSMFYNSDEFPEMEMISRTQEWHRIFGKRLSEIVWPGGKLEFIESNEFRNDVNDLPANLEKGHFLKEIKVLDKPVSGNVVKSFNFNHSYFQPLVSSYDIDMFSDHPSFFKRLKLESVYETDKNGKKMPPYRFEYNGVELPEKVSSEVDYWGYYNGNGAKISKPNVYCNPVDPDISLFDGIYSIYNTGDADEINIIDGSNREPNGAFNKAGVLEKIIYPTGGFQSFEYETHEFLINNEIKKGGGLRIKRIVMHDGVDVSNDMITNFTYSTNDDLCSGKITKIPQFCKWNYDAYNKLILGHPELSSYEVSRITTTRYSQGLGGLGGTKGSFIGYTQVTVSKNGNGKTVYNYDFPASYEDNEDLINQDNVYLYQKPVLQKPAIYNDLWMIYSAGGFSPLIYIKDNFPFPSNPDIDWGRGNIIEEKTFDEGGILLKKTEYIYNYPECLRFLPEIKANLFTVERGFLSSGFLDKDENGETIYFGFINCDLFMTDIRWSVSRNVSGGVKTLKQKIETIDNVTTIKNYFYESFPEGAFYANQQNSSHMFLKSETTQLNPTDEIKIQYNRPLDIGPEVISLINKHILNPVLEKITSRNGLITSSTMVEYGTFGEFNDLIQPYKIYSIETDHPLTSSEFENGFYTSNINYSKKAQINYNSKGNISEIQEIGQAPVSLLWSYNQQYPVARSTNVLTSNDEEKAWSYLGFENNKTDNNNPDNDFWPLLGKTIVNDGYTGKYCLKNLTGEIWGPVRTLKPETEYQNEKFIFSAWVKTTASCDGRLFIEIKNSLGENLTENAADWTFSSEMFGNTNSVWKYFEVPFDLKQVRTITGAAANEQFTINCKLWSPTGKEYKIDDIKIRPENSQMVTYCYDPLVGISSIVNEKEVASFYDYNEYNKLTNIRNFDKNVISNFDYNFASSAIPEENALEITDLYFYSLTSQAIVEFAGGQAPYTAKACLFDMSGNEIYCIPETTIVPPLLHLQWNVSLLGEEYYTPGEEYVVVFTITDANGDEVSGNVIYHIP